MEINKLCKTLGFDKHKFLLYLEHLKVLKKRPIELSLETKEDFEKYVSDPNKEYSFITFCNDLNTIPFEDEIIPRTCANCAFLMKEIDEDNYFCGDNYVDLTNTCDNHVFAASEVSKCLPDVYHR